MSSGRRGQGKLADQRTDAHMNRPASLEHELIQSLTAILHNAEAAQLLLDFPSPDIRALQQILSDMKSNDLRASAIVRHLREPS
jgi:hypothetical protein